MSRGDDMVKNTSKLLDEARKVGVTIVYLQHTNLANHKSDSAPRIYYGLRGFDTNDPSRYPLWCEPDTWGHQIVDELKPQEEDLIIRKHRPSAFMTNLDHLLRNNDIKTVIMTGDATSGCVEANARLCLYRDYFVVVLRDCVDQAGKEGHDLSLKVMDSIMNVEDSKKIIEIWMNMNKQQ
jgi:ureidoacrylate peracid hydrolase